MAASGQRDRSSEYRWRWLRIAVGLVLGLTIVATLPGCGGCRKKTPAQLQKEKEKREAEERARREREKPKPNFVVSTLATRPSKPAALETVYKPGHWTATTLMAKANNFDFVGSLQIAAVDGNGDQVSLEATPFELTTARQIALPKGQPKIFESVAFIPAGELSRGDDTDKLPAGVACRMHFRKGGRLAKPFGNPLQRMPSYQYHFVVLARWPDRYAYLTSLHSVKPPVDTLYRDPAKSYYRVSLMPGEGRLSLPSHSLMWTSIACMLWDDAEPDSLSTEQQQALLDWLHWGGHLIVSGPDTLDTLGGSFLGPYLPATATSGKRQITAADFSQTAEWSDARKKKPARPMRFAKPWTGVQLEPKPQGRFIPGSGDLLVEGRVGRGRVIISAFRLSGRDLVAWQGFDEFFNAFLLRRPKREFFVCTGAESVGPEGPVGFGSITNGPGVGTNASDATAEELNVGWADGGGNLRDARHISQLRYFTRDTGVEFKDYGRDVMKRRRQEPNNVPYGYPGNPSVSWADPQPGPGLAAWNDFSQASNEARHALTDAAKIEIPDADFVVWVVAGYLLILVPANWFVFRIIGRVEWCWIAAPVIAIGCTALVIRLAQLDIGFARARTEIAVAELHAGYPRAHVTRYTAVYTSLTSRYDFQLKDPGSVMLPFSSVDRARDFSMEFGERPRRLLHSREQNARLQGFLVRSNTIGMMHGEQMIDFGGDVSLTENPDGGLQVTNNTLFDLKDAAIIAPQESGRSRIARLGTIEPGASARVTWEWKDSSTLLPRSSSSELDLRALVDLAAKPDYIEPGETRLIAIIDEEIPGMVIRQAAPQVRQAAMVVAHLKFGHGKDPQADDNTAANPIKKRSAS